MNILCGDVIEQLRTLPADSVHCCVTSPPYFGLRDYGVAGQIGLEASPELFVAKMVEVFAEVRRVLHPSGVMFCNLGDSYAGGGGFSAGAPTTVDSKSGKYGSLGALKSGGIRPAHGIKQKDLCGIPWRVYLALQQDGWYWRDCIVWHKPAPMPESVTDRCTKAWEPIGMFTKSAKYYYDAVAVAEEADTAGDIGGFTGYQATAMNRPASGNQIPEKGRAYIRPQTRNKRNVWTVPPEPFAEAHFATFPSELPRTCIKAGSSEHGVCPTCLAPWKRITDKQKLTRERPNELTKRTGEDGTGNSCANTVAGVEVTTLGWEPTCKCNAGEPIRATVLDPFLGSGTTGAVAYDLGREFVGIELNPEYVKLAQKRIGKMMERTALLDRIA